MHGLAHRVGVKGVRRFLRYKRAKPGEKSGGCAGVVLLVRTLLLTYVPLAVISSGLVLVGAIWSPPCGV